MGPRGRAGIGVAAALAVGLALLPGGGPASAAEAVVTVTDVVVRPSTDDLADGFATVAVDVSLESTTPLADDLGPGTDTFGGVAVAEPVGGSVPAPGVGESGPGPVWWESLSRVSGTPQDGVWRGTVEVTRIWSGSWVVTRLRDFSSSDPFAVVDVSEFGAEVDLGTGDVPPWRALPAPVPVRVVTGEESWTPLARVVDRASGAGVPAGFVDYDFYAEPYGRPSTRLPAGWPVGRADAQGLLTLGARPVVFEDGEWSRNVVHVYAGRGSRGYSWEASTILWPQVKWQANQRFSVTGRTVTASGNAWPAPSVYSAAENRNIHLQHLVGRTWRTVATAQVRYNGRYTINWAAPSAGPQVLRVYKPGGSTDRTSSVGTTLGFVTVSTR